MAAESPNVAEWYGMGPSNDKSSPDQCLLEASRLRRRFSIRIYANLTVVSLCLLVVFTAQFPIATIQSSLNSQQGMGTASLSVHTGAAMLQAAFFNALVLGRLGLKGSMLLGIVLMGVYIALNMYPTWYTMIPSALIAGVGFALLRVAESTYIARLASIYANQMDLAPDIIKSRFFAVYYVFYCSARVFGNVASSLILGGSFSAFSIPSEDVAQLQAANSSACGADYCDLTMVGNTSQMVETALRGTDIYHVYYLCIFCIGCLILAFVIMALFLDNLESLSLKRHGVNITLPRDSEPTPHSWRDLLSTIRTWRNPQQVLLLPLCIYNGVDNVFWQADFTKSFVTCAYGIKWVGFVVAWYGLTAPLIVLVLALTSQVVCRPVPFLVALVAHIGTSVSLLQLPLPSLPCLFMLSGFWGIGSGLWPVCLVAYHGIVFEKNLEAAFATYWLCDSLGGAIAYACSYFLCMSSKIAIMIGLSSIGVLGYLLTEMSAFVAKVRHGQSVDPLAS